MKQVLTINGGSSSVKFAVYAGGAAPPPPPPPRQVLAGRVERIGLPAAQLVVNHGVAEPIKRPVAAPDHQAAASAIIEFLNSRSDAGDIAAISHRIVHGGPKFSRPERVTSDVLDELRRISPLDPEHLPAEIGLVETFAKRYPNLPQVACFDTAFHRGMPRVAKLLAVPRRFEAEGVQRYGFHGLSYEYLIGELAHSAGDGAARGRVILCHFGNGVSLAAVKDGRSIDTSMAFTPSAGTVMGTRTGDIDPGLVRFLERTQNLSPEEFDRMMSHESGLLGVSETSSDMRDLVARRPTDPRAAEAVDLFCYSAKKWIGAYAAVLGGVDTLVFAGGIGENAPEVRAGACAGLEFLGIDLDPARNAANAPVISRAGARATVRIIPTDEEAILARAGYDLLAGAGMAG